MHIKNSITFSCAALLSCMTACAPAGYYDSTGVYHSYGNSDTYRTNTPRDNAPAPGAYSPPPNGYSAPTYSESHPGGYPDEYNVAQPVPTTTVIYDRPGYYDYNGYYISSDSGPGVPKRYFPSQGMCRVWFTDRPAAEEPPAESCDGIRSRVPQGAYVIYGG